MKKHIVLITFIALILPLVLFSTIHALFIHPTGGGHPVPLMLYGKGGVDFKDRMLHEITNPSTSTHAINRISAIKEFYLPIEIEGFVLDSVYVSGGAFNYTYAPKDKVKTGEEVYIPDNEYIRIGIYRSDSDYYAASLEEFAKVNDLRLTKDGLVFDNWSSYRSVDGVINGKRFGIHSSDSFDVNYLRDLAFSLIETAELVIVE